MDLQEQIDFVNSYPRELRVMTHKKPTYELPKGVKAVDYQKVSSNVTGNTGTQYTINCNSNQIISDYITEEISFTVSFSANNGTAGAITLLNQGNWAPRCLPIESATSSSQVTINGSTVAINSQDVIYALMSFNKTPEIATRDLPCSMLDTYTDLVGTQGGAPAGAPAFASMVGSIQNQMLDYYSSVYGMIPRVSDVKITALTNPQAAAAANQNYSVTFIVRQPIITGVTSLSHETSSGIMGCTVLQFQRTFTSNLAQRLVEVYVPANVNITNLTATVNGASTLYYTLYSVPDDYVIEYPLWYPVTDYGTSSSIPAQTAVASGANVTISSIPLQLDRVPRAVYVWVANPGSGKSITSSDAPGYQIQNLAVSAFGVGGQFSSCQPYQLYERFCGGAGCMKAFSETGAISTIVAAGGVGALTQTGAYGSVLRIDATDFSGIPWDQVSVGSAFQCNIQVQVTATNLSGANKTPSLFIQVIHDSMLSIQSPTSSQLFKAILTKESVKQIRDTKPYEFVHDRMLGGNFLGDLWSGVKDVAKSAWDHRGDIANVVKTVAPMVGLGKKKVGGSMVQKAALRRRLEGHGFDSDDE
jgi:hypothetical protein